MHRSIARTGACVAVLVPTTSWAFCGLYVAEPGKTVENHASQVIWAHYEGITTITIGADFAGEVSSFGLLVPVPPELEAEDVQIVEPAVFTELEQYTTPRLVRYTCEDFAGGGHRYGRGWGCYAYDMAVTSDGGMYGPQADDGVEVEARFTVGEYEVAILNTEDASALSAWLTTHGFAGPVDKGGILQGYIDAGTHFLAARVLLDALPEGRQWLSPLQFSYASDSFWLPIRIGTLAATGPQEVVIYGITDAEDGELHIENFDQVTVEDECLWEPADGETLDTFYGRQVDAAFDGRAGWLVEYSIPVIGQAQCDPCTSEAPLYVDNLPRYGWHDDAVDTAGGYIAGGAHLTRLRVRYTPEQATSDLHFTMGGPAPMSQIRYLEHLSGLEAMFPVCGVGLVEDPGSCDQDALSTGGNGAVACATPSGTHTLGALVGLLFAVRRRRGR